MKQLIILFFCLVLFKAEAQSSALNIADSLYTLGEYSKAIKVYSQVDLPKAKLQIARVYNLVRNYDKAIVEYESIVQNDSSAQLPQFELGKLYEKTKKAKKALKLFKQLTIVNKNNPEYFYYLGNAYSSLDSIPKNINTYKKTIEIDSSHLRSIHKIAKYYVKEKERDSVIKYANKGLKFYENDAVIINLKALALYNNEEYKTSISLFEQLLKLGEFKPYIFEYLANAYSKVENYDKAIVNYKNTLIFDDENERALFNLGNAYWKKKELDSAKIYIKKAIDVQQVSFDKEYQTLARIAGQEKDLKSALAYYQLAHQEAPKNVVYYYQMCIIAEMYYKDPKIKLNYYEQLVSKYSNQKNFYVEYAERRISELKQEIHLTTN